MSAYAQVPLGEVATITAGQSPPSSTYNDSGEGLPFFQGKADFGELHPVARKWCSAPKKIAEAGDILISVRAPVGPTNVAAERCCIGRGLVAVHPDEKVVLRDWLLWSIKYRQDELVVKARGSTFLAIGQKDLKNLLISLPPLNEQRRTVARIKSLFDKTDKGVESLSAAKRTLDLYRKSILKSAFEGRLTDGSTSNTHVGRAFEERVRQIFAKHDLRLDSGHKVPCGLGVVKKNHAFDLGSEDPRVIVECKSHAWTSGGNVPSAKMKNWAEAMFYFHMAPEGYRKILFVGRSMRFGRAESLLSYFLRTQAHLIPPDVEFWELDRDNDKLVVHEAPV